MQQVSGWGRGGVTAAKVRWIWAVQWVEVVVEQQVVEQEELLSDAGPPAPSGGSPRQ